MIPTGGVNSRCATPHRSELIDSRQSVWFGVNFEFGELSEAMSKPF